MTVGEIDGVNDVRVSEEALAPVAGVVTVSAFAIAREMTSSASCPCWSTSRIERFLMRASNTSWMKSDDAVRMIAESARYKRSSTSVNPF